MTEKRVMKLASRGKRFGAACIDAFVPFVSYLLYSAVLAANGISMNYPGYGNGFGGFGNDFGYGYGYGYGYGFGTPRLNGASAVIMAVVSIILLAYIVLELVLFSKGKSIGKAMLGLQVVSSNDGKPFRFWKMFFRECFVKSASGSVLGLGYIWILIDEKNRGWHDKILDSYVVDLKESERMNLRRHLDKARAAAASDPVPEVKEVEPVIPDVQPVEEPPAEVTTEVVEIETESEAGDAAEAETVTLEEVTGEVTEETGEVPENEGEAVTEELSVEITEDATDITAETPELSMSMKKEELLEAARQRGVQVSSRATKAAIIEAIEKAEKDTE